MNVDTFLPVCIPTTLHVTHNESPTSGCMIHLIIDLHLSECIEEQGVDDLLIISLIFPLSFRFSDLSNSSFSFTMSV